VAALLTELDAPLMSSSLLLPGEQEPLFDVDEIVARLRHQVDIVVDSGFCGLEATTVVDLEAGVPSILREGKGDPAPFR
jgi:tRNA A37 threonylcarbamoyladenosine synthetase subunit TsaC/SUA5/YrdC